MSSMKKPFGKIGMKLGKKQNIDDKKIQDNNQQQKQVSKTPKFKLQSNKPKKNIYDAVRKVDEQKSQEQEHENKPVLNLKPSFKRNKLTKNETPTNFNNKSQELNNQSKQDYQQSQKRVPLFNRYKNRGLGERSKQKVVIQEPQQQNSNEYERYDKNQREIGQSNNFEENQDHQLQQKHNKLMKPNMKIKKGSQNPKITPKINSQRTEVFQQYKETNNQNSAPFSMAQMMNIQATQINISKRPQQISGDKIKKQQKRAHELSKLLNLQIDLYEQLISISSVTSFQVYINKIKGGFLKNSSDQAFDEKVSDSCQTLTFQYVDFSNQCPQDYQGISHQSQSDAEQNFNSFLLGISPIIEELIKPTQNITMPPTSLLAFRPVFKNFIKCPNPSFIYYSEEWNISILVIGQKLYITEGQIQCVLNLGGSILSGLKNSKIVLWNGQNDRGSILYYKIEQAIQSKNFQLPSFVTNQIDKLSPYVCEGSIKNLISSSDQSTDFYSLDENAKMIKWRLQQKSNKKIIITGIQSIDFSNLIQKKYLIGYSIKKRNQIFYILTSFGLLCWNGQQIVKKIQVGHVRQFYLPKRSNLIYVISQFNKILIFNETLTSQIFQFKIKTDEQITEIIIPEIQHQNQVISIFYHIYLIGKNGGIYELKLLQNQIQQVSLTNIIASKKKIKNDSDDENQGQPIKSKRQKGFIFNGVNLIGNKLQTIKLLQDLKYSTSEIKLTVNMQRSVPNLKKILNSNKQLISSLQQKSMILV